MAVAALVLSAVAIVFSALSVIYARRQALAAEQTRHAELEPTLVLEYVPQDRMRNGVRPGIRLTNRGRLVLERTLVEVVPPARTDEAAIEGIYDPLTDGPAANQEIGRLAPGDAWTALEIIPVFESMNDGGERQSGGVVSFRCTCCAAGHSPWTIVVDVEIPTDPWVF